MRKTGTDYQRFWRHVDVRGPDDCWPWKAAVLRNGYGTFRIGSLTDGTRANVGSHRYSLEIAGRPLSKGKMALHTCDNKRCVNPRHLYEGDAKDNARDAAERGLLPKNSYPGEGNPRAKITEADARFIFASKESLSVLGRRFGISKTQVSHIKQGRSWGYLHGDNNVLGTARRGGELAG